MIKVENVSMRFRMSNDNMSSLKEFAIAAIKHKISYDDFWVFKNINFEVKKGEVVGIVGRNGAGKSTILKIISGILTPTTGKVTLNGNVVPMLELGSGFDQDLTGRENIFLNGSILGYSEEFLKEKYDEIVEFSELGEFIESPIRNYSSGMMMRLAFSVATIVQPEILIVDEILAVGDEAFQKKSKRKMLELMGGGTTVLFVSHSIDQIREMCNRVIWLEKGEVKMEGETKMVCDAYQKYINPVADEGDKKHKATDAPKHFSDVLFVYGDDDVAYDWRVTNQREQLRAGQVNSNEIYYKDLTQDLVKKYRAFVFVSCEKNEKIESFILKAKEFNKKVIFDINKCNEDNRFYEKQKELLVSTQKKCDAVIVTNEILEKEYRDMGFQVIRNELSAAERTAEYAAWATYDRDVLPFMNQKYMSEDELINYNKAIMVRKKRIEGGMRIGFFGDTLVSKRFGMIQNVIMELLEEHSDLVLYVEDLEQRIPEKMEKYKNRIVFKSQTDKEDKLRDCAEVDIALYAIWNENDEWDICIENKIYASLAKIPYIVFEKEGAGNEFIFNSESLFKNKIESLIANREVSVQLGKKGYSSVRKNECAIYKGFKFANKIKQLFTPNIVFSVVGDYFSDINMQIFYHVEKLKSRGWDVTLVCQGKEQADIVFEENIIPVISRDLVYFSADLDVAVATDAQGMLWLQEYGRTARRLYYVTSYEPDNYKVGNKTKILAQQALMPYCKMEYITNSEILQKKLKTQYNIDVEYFEPQIEYKKFVGEKGSHEKIRILIQGDGLNENDNLDFAFKIVDKLDLEKFEIHFWAYGRVPRSYFHYDVLHQNLKQKEVYEMFKTCDVLLKTNLKTDGGIADLAMMATGGIILKSDMCESPDYLKENETCICFENGNIQSAVDLLNQLQAEPQNFNGIRKNGKEKAAKYACENSTDFFADLIEG